MARAEQVLDLYVLKEGFGLTLEGKALSWFQTLDIGTYHSFESLEKDFIGAFTKIGIKHSVSTLISNFKQDKKETVRDCANRLMQYISRCPESELPSQEKIVSIFLEGLRDKTLHADLYGKKHKTLNECMHEAIDLDDNFDIYGKEKPFSLVDSLSYTSTNTQETSKDKTNEAKATVEMIMKIMNHVFKPPNPRPIRCEIFAGDHPISYCLPKQNYQAYKPTPKIDKWCDFKKRWTNHETQECYHRIRHLREQGIAQNTQGGVNQVFAYVPRGINHNYGQLGGGERAQLVLGN